MSYEETLRSISLNADASLAVYTGVPGAIGSPSPGYGKQYTAVKVTGVGQVGQATAKGADIPLGIMQNKPQVTGQAATVAFAGVSNVMAGGAINAGQPVTFDGSGRAIVGVPGTDKILGVALGSVTAANTLVPVALQLG